MITSVEAAHVAIRAIVSAASGVPLSRVILADQGKPAPTGKTVYATYKPVPIRAVGHPRKERVLVAATEPTTLTDWEDFDETTVSQMEFMVSCNFLNDGSVDAAHKLHNANFRVPVQELLYVGGVGWKYASEVRNLTNMFQADYQERYQVDLHLRLETAITDTVLRANSFTVNIEDENGNVLSHGGQ